MERGEFRRDQHAVLVQTGHMRNAGAAKPNAKRDVHAMYLSAWFGDFGDYHEVCGGRVVPRGRRGFEGGSKDLMQEKMKRGM